jgi:hypothetical protein
VLAAPMDLLVDLLLLLAAVMLVDRSNTDRDEVWQLCLRILAVVSVLVVITSDRGLPLALLLLLVALSLPGAGRLEPGPDSALQPGSTNPAEPPA